MADKKISELNALAAGDVASDDLFVVVDVGSSETKKITTANLASALNFTVGNGNVVGPASSTNNSVAIFDGTSGELLKSPGSALTFDGTTLTVNGPALTGKHTVVPDVGVTPIIVGKAATGAYGFVSLNNDLSISTGLGIFGGDAGDPSNLYVQAPSAAAFRIGSSEQMRLTSTGLGIGTSSPAQKLHLQDNAAVFIQMTDVGDGSSRIGQNGTALTFGVDTGNGTTERARIDTSGNFIHQVNATAPTLSTNSTMSFELTSNTSLKIVVRGTDGTTRSVSLTLA